MSTYFTRSASLSGFVPVARSLGIDPYSLLDAYGVTPLAVVDPDLKIDVQILAQLLEGAASQSGFDDFGARIALTRVISDYGALGLVLREQPTLRDALRMAVRYTSIQTEGLSFCLETSGGESVLTLSTELVDGRGFRQAKELVLGSVVRMLTILSQGRLQPVSVAFSHSGQRVSETHRSVFRCPVLFDQPSDALVFADAALSGPIPGADPVMARHARAYVEALKARSSTVSGQVRRLSRALLPAGLCSLHNVARHLGVEPRTLQRRLDAEGVSFSQVLSDVRSEQVVDYLADPRRSLADITALLGFSEPSAFSRWFSGRFGCGARQWRNGVRR